MNFSKNDNKKQRKNNDRNKDEMNDDNGVHLEDCDDEWFYNLSLVDGYNLLSFLDDSGLVLPDGFTDKVESLMGQPDTLVEVS